ncbi:MAG: threonine synthase [Wenzhouxiangellaceae bacterium]|nr:threonine synthase [Wenzhouxiangellaceae bacterium]
MRYVSTRAEAPPVTVDRAIRAGLAPDGGLYVPERLPRIDTASVPADASLPAMAAAVLAPMFAGSRLAAALPSICDEALDLPLPIRERPGRPRNWIMELFHGPTAAFKDFAARFLARSLAAVDDPPRTVLVATSGDTGAAVAAAFHGQPGMRVLVLFPDGRVSPRQAHQLGAFGGNVRALRVRGSFDDCQRLVKGALADPDLVERFGLTSANSISVGRLLPQVAYYALAARRLAEHGPIDVIVPTGNLGNALACVLAREMGSPIGRVVLATNANRTLPDFFAGARYAGRPGLRTLANAMDVGDPSNFERLAWLYRERDVRDQAITAESVDDEAIRSRIAAEYTEHGEIVCPHTACALECLARLRHAGDESPLLVAATAHPAKFESVVEPLIGRPVLVPESLQRLLDAPSSAEPIDADAGKLVAQLERQAPG